MSTILQPKISPTTDAMTLGRFRLIYDPQGIEATALALVSEQHSDKLFTFRQWALLLRNARRFLES